MPFSLDENLLMLLPDLFTDLLNIEKEYFEKSPIFLMPFFTTAAPFESNEKKEPPVFPSFLY